MSTAHRHIARGRAKKRTGAPRARWPYLVGAIAAVLAITTILSTAGFDGTSIANAAVEKAKSFIQLMQQRSPGERTRTMLIKTKHKKILAHERALPKVRVALPEIPPPTFTPALIDIVAPPPVVMASLEAINIPPLLQSSPPPGVPTFEPPSLIVPPTETTTTPPIVTPPSAVPEPSTWMTMLLGFGFIGWQLRRRRPERKQLLTN
jgi:hypothetical protein